MVVGVAVGAATTAAAGRTRAALGAAATAGARRQMLLLVVMVMVVVRVAMIRRMVDGTAVHQICRRAAIDGFVVMMI